MVRIIADEFLTEERDRKYYADHYTCCPPPLFVLLITLIEVSKSTVAVSGEALDSGKVTGRGDVEAALYAGCTLPPPPGRFC
jgi:rhomboid-related protein 1/2/3